MSGRGGEPDNSSFREDVTDEFEFDEGFDCGFLKVWLAGVVFALCGLVALCFAVNGVPKL